eukprot:5579043-Prymnesium_polylepis.1
MREQLDATRESEHHVDLEPTLLLTIGSFQCCAGTADHDHPHAVLPSVVGRQKQGTIMLGLPFAAADHVVGDTALSKRSNLNLTFPIENGLVIDFVAMDKIWGCIFREELRVASEELPCPSDGGATDS